MNASHAILDSGIMNEPHDIPDVATWVDTVQQTVNAIRQAGATNFLLLPGSSWASAQAFPTEAGPGLVKVTDPLGGTNKLIFDGTSGFVLLQFILLIVVCSPQIPRQRQQWYSC